MGDTKIKVGGKLIAITASGILAGADQIIDVGHADKTQQQINKEFKDAIASITTKFNNLSNRKRIFIKHYSSSKTYEGMFAYVIPGETIKFGVYTSAKNNISIEAIAFNSSKKNPTTTVANPVVTALGSYVFHVISMTIPTDVADGDIYLYKTMTVTS